MTSRAAATASQQITDPLPRGFYAVPVVELARRLLGATIWTEDGDGLSAGRIVETEAYGGPEDRASHARAGLTRRTAPMFGPPGHAYVYLVYGMHECLNVVAEEEGRAGAVLLRAAEPLLGVELMRRRRGRPADPVDRLAAGPARLAQALGVSRRLDGHDLTLGHRLWLELDTAAEAADSRVASGPRIGVAYAADGWAERPWRFWLTDSQAVSR
jgi:DNA-3-methyladenine glycosylase